MTQYRAVIRLPFVGFSTPDAAKRYLTSELSRTDLMPDSIEIDSPDGPQSDEPEREIDEC